MVRKDVALRKKCNALWGTVAAFALSLGVFATSGFGVLAADKTETEPNDSAETATLIPVNTKVVGNIGTENDVDWYKFEVTEPGTISMTFSHIATGSYDQYWITDLYADAEEKICYTSNYWKGGDAASKSTDVFNVPAGIYYLKVRKYSYNSSEYGIKISYTAAKENEEHEDNGSALKANEIEVNKEYNGKLSLDGDVDYYKFTISEPGALSVTFSHIATGSYDQYWITDLYADAEEKICYTSNYWKGGDAASKSTDVFNVPAGTYYLKVRKYSYNSSEYGIKINYTSAVGTNSEQESNDTGATANAIEVNKDYRGRISLEKELDWYAFEITEPSDISVVLSHDVINSDDYFWNVRIFDDVDMQNKYMDLHWQGSKEKQTSETTPRLSEGKYYAVVSKSRAWSLNEYTFSVNATPLNLDCAWLEKGGKNYWYEGGVRQGTYGDAKGVIGDGTVRGREICDNNILDANGNGTWFWLDSVYDGAKAVGKEVWMPYIYQDEANWDDTTKANIAAESDYGMEGMGRCVLDAINNKSGKWVRYDNEGKMLKGWVEIKGDLATAYPDQKGNVYYYDTRTGLMAKGWVKIDGKDYFFDETTGVLQK